MQTTIDPIVDFCNALFNGVTIDTIVPILNGVTIDTTVPILNNINITNPLIWIAAVQDPATMQELILTNKYAQLLLILYDASLANINKLGLTEAACRSLIRRLGLEEKLKREAREILNGLTSR